MPPSTLLVGFLGMWAGVILMAIGMLVWLVVQIDMMVNYSLIGLSLMDGFLPGTRMDDTLNLIGILMFMLGAMLAALSTKTKD